MSRGSISHNYEYIPSYSNHLQNIASTRLMLNIRQQPVQTRLSTNNERDRRIVDPPPIVQIDLENSNIQETQDFLQNPNLFMSVSLVHPVSHENIIENAQKSLSGQTVSSMYKLKDINNQDGGFFVFGDLSVKMEGQYRLKFSIFEISPFGATNIKSIYSNVFQVYSSKAFPGMLESTFLSRSFSDQGVRIRIRKEHRVQMASSRKRKASTAHDDCYPIERRRSSVMSYPLGPISPPHQPYDSHGRPEWDGYYQQMVMPSPPPITPFKPNDYNYRPEERLPPRRQSADAYYSFRLSTHEPRRLSLQHTTKEVIHLPPLRSMWSSKKEGEVDAAVAMMELATKRPTYY